MTSLSRHERQAVIVTMLTSVLLMLLFVFFFPFETRGPLVLRRPFLHQSGHAYVGHFLFIGPKPDKRGNQNQSTLQLFEDDKLLGPQHISSDDVARTGHGLYLFWSENGDTVVVFSSSDNSDPDTNGRTYRIFDPLAKEPPDPYEKNLRVK